MGKVTDINDKKAAQPGETIKKTDRNLIEVPDPPPDVQAMLRTISREGLLQFALGKAMPMIQGLLLVLGSAMARCKNCHADESNFCAECSKDMLGVHLVTAELTMLSKCMAVASAPGSVIAVQRAAEQAQAEKHAETCSDCRTALTMQQKGKPVEGGTQVIIPDNGDDPDPKS